MNESFEDLQQLAGEYVLGTLSFEKRLEIERRCQTEPELRLAIENWERRLLPLTSLPVEQEPSPQLWSRIANTLTPSPTTQQVSWSNWWNNLWLWRSFSAGSFVVAVLLAITIFIRPPLTTTTSFMVVLVEPANKNPGWVVQANLQREITLIPLHSVEIPNQKSLQFWTKGDGWKGPASLGLVQPGKSLKLSLDKLPPLETNQLFEITLEPVNGSSTGKPSGPVLFIGNAVKVI